MELNQGDIVGPDASWNSNSNAAISYIYSRWNGVIEYAAAWAGEDKTLGLRFQIDGQSHYGWMRLSLVKKYTEHFGLRYFIIQDFAWEMQPDTPIEVGVSTVDPARQLTLTDVGETGTPADLRLTFLGADNESGISAYRVYLIPTTYSNIPPSFAELLPLDETRYKTVAPGAINNTIYFSDEDLTVEGLPITQGDVYNAVVISVADGILAINNIISIQSHYQYLSIRTTDPVNYIDLGLIPVLNNIGDFNVSFYEGDTMGVASHRIYLLKKGGYVPPDSLLNLNENYYTEITSISPGYHHEVKLNPEQLVVNELVPEFFNNYYVAVATIANQITATYSAVNYNNEETDDFTEYFVKVYPERPLVTIENPANNTSNIRVQFPHTAFEEDLVYYKFMITQAADTSYYNAANANAANSTTESVKFTPTGSDINLNMKPDMTDVHSSPVDSVTEYVIYCLLYFKDNSTKFTLSLPSKPFKLNRDYGIPPTHQIFINNEILEINLISFNSFEFAVMNTSGQIVYKGLTGGTSTRVDLSFLANGVYFVKVNGFNMDAEKIIIVGK